jgi:tetratricopeptide (TPR) repeat protein
MLAEVEIAVNTLRYGLLAIVSVSIAAAQPEQGKALNDCGVEALARGDLSAAQDMLSASLQIWLSLGLEFEPHAATTLMNLGDVRCAQGQWNEAAGLFERALDLNLRSVGPKNVRTVSNRNRLANVYLVLAEFDRAEPLYRNALSIGRELYPDSLVTAHSLQGLASLHSRTGKLDQAIAESEEALVITLKAVGENDVESGMAYIGVGQIHRIAGRTDRALPLLRKARAIFERNLGPADPRMGSVLSQEGLALMHENKLALAERDLVRAVELLSQSKTGNVELAIAEHNLGLLRLRQKKYKEADALFLQSRIRSGDIRPASLGPVD